MIDVWYEHSGSSKEDMAASAVVEEESGRASVRWCQSVTFGTANVLSDLYLPGTLLSA